METIKCGQIYERHKITHYYGVFKNTDRYTGDSEQSFNDLKIIMVLEKCYIETERNKGHWIKILTSEGYIRFLWLEEELEKFFDFFTQAS